MTHSPTPTPLITPEDRIFVAGHRGMAGSAICRALQSPGYTQLLTASREELDLLDGSAVERWFAEHEPTVVVLAAAKMGGIKLCQALRQQHGFDAISLMPTNLYAPGDNDHPANSHAMAAMTRRFQDAVKDDATHVMCWGTGTPRHEFLHVDDLAEACVITLERWQPGAGELPWINVGTGVDLTIHDLALQLAQATGFTGEIGWDTTKPDGTPRKQLDVSRIEQLGCTPKHSLCEGLANLLETGAV